MRFLLEVIVAAALIALSWDKSFKQWAREAPVIGSYFSAQLTAKSKTNVAPPPPQSFTGHILYTDEQGKKYWLDAQGKRHYQP